MRRGRDAIGMLLTLVGALLGLVLTMDTAVAQPSGPARPGEISRAAIPAGPQPTGTPERDLRLTFSAPHDSHDPFDDCRHRRPVRATLAGPPPQPDTLAPAFVMPRAEQLSRPAVPWLGTTEAVPPRPGELPGLLQVFRC